jgi:hypothetical protein
VHRAREPPEHDLENLATDIVEEQVDAAGGVLPQLRTGVVVLVVDRSVEPELVYQPAALILAAGDPDRRAPRAAARHVKLAICAPVTNPALEPRGRPSRSSTHPAATSSATATGGRGAVHPAHLIPGGRQPVRADGDGQGAADDKP